MKIAILCEESIDAIRAACDSLTGCADHISYAGGDDETADAIDHHLVAIGKAIDHAVVEWDAEGIIENWIIMSCDKELEEVNNQIRQENLWCLGSQNEDQSSMHVANMFRLEAYKRILTTIKNSIVKEVHYEEVPVEKQGDGASAR